MENRVKSVFGDYATGLQILVNENEDKFKEVFYPSYFNMGTPQPGLSFATAIGRSRIEAAASVVAHGSEAPLRGRAGLEKLSGEVSAIKVKRKMDEQEYRNWLVMQNMNVPDESRKQQIINLIWNDVRYVADAVRSRIDIMVKQALSQGKVTINATTNPDGIVPGDVDLLISSDNKLGVTDLSQAYNAHNQWKDDDDNIGTATPISDIAHVVETYEDKGIEFEKILMTPTKWRAIAKIDEVTELLGTRPTFDEVNNYLSDRGLPIIELVKGKHQLESGGTLSTYTAWQDKYVTFIPSGSLGLIHNAVAIEEITPVAGVDYAMSNRTLISKWSQTEPFGEFTRGEIAAFPGLEAADNVVLVNTESENWA